MVFFLLVSGFSFVIHPSHSLARERERERRGERIWGFVHPPGFWITSFFYCSGVSVSLLSLTCTYLSTYILYLLLLTTYSCI